MQPATPCTVRNTQTAHLQCSNCNTDDEKIGKRDQRGRSLRDFELQPHLFRYPCSYLIHFDAFNGLPTLFRTSILQNLVTV